MKTFSRISSKHCIKLIFCRDFKYCFTKSLPLSTLPPTTNGRTKMMKMTQLKPNHVGPRRLPMAVSRARGHCAIHGTHWFEPFTIEHLSPHSNKASYKFSCIFYLQLWSNRTKLYYQVSPTGSFLKINFTGTVPSHTGITVR